MLWFVFHCFFLAQSHDLSSYSVSLSFDRIPASKGSAVEDELGDDLGSDEEDVCVDGIDLPDGVEFDVHNDVWVAEKSCSSFPIPHSPTAEFRQWFQKRALGSGLLRDESGCLKIDAEGYLIGPDCVSDTTQCSRCNLSLAECDRLDLGLFVLRTRIGAVRRRRIGLRCQRCEMVHTWNASLECIHTIRGGAEGG